jgi:spermidine/putrescine-binding protein
MGESEEPDKMSRRKYLKVAAGVAAGAAIAAGAGYAYFATRPKPKLRYLGYPFFLPDPDGIEKWNEENPEMPIDATFEDFLVLSMKQLANPRDWDVGGSGMIRHLIDEGVLLTVPVSELSNWKADEMMECITDPDSYFPPKVSERFKSLLWEEVGTTLRSVPLMWNYDSFSYLPKFLPFEEKGSQVSMGYEELHNPEWKGRVASIDDPMVGLGQVANYLDASGQAVFEGPPTNMTHADVDKCFNFLLPDVQAGQFKSFWFKYSDSVSILATEEVYLTMTYQPACFDSRKAGTPTYYACLRDGPFFWTNNNIISKYASEKMVPWCYKFADWQIDLWCQMVFTKQGYPSPRIYSDDYKEAMGDEFYDWFYMDKATYLPIDEVMQEIWPDREEFWTLEERLQNALFLPDVYFKHFWEDKPPRTGSPDPNGNRRDIGSVAFKQEITRYFLTPDLPDDNDYYVTKWEQLKAALP